MKKPITKKYYIESVLADSLSTKIEVSKSKFEQALKDMEKQFAAQEAQEGSDFFVERDMRQNDKGNFVENQIEFRWSINSIYFITLECKEGFRFTK